MVPWAEDGHDKVAGEIPQFAIGIKMNYVPPAIILVSNAVVWLFDNNNQPPRFIES